MGCEERCDPLVLGVGRAFRVGRGSDMRDGRRLDLLAVALALEHQDVAGTGSLLGGERTDV